MSVTVPEGLSELLEEFAVTVLREKPKDLFGFAATYFHDLNLSKKQGGGELGKDSIAAPEVEMSGQESDEEAIAPPTTSYMAGMERRRKSVFAESYEPDEDDGADKVVHPKTDEQRKRLAEAVSKSFLFRNLDPEQCKEVLDAIFERQVCENERIIEQGDDGDNFYIVGSGTFNCYVATDNEPPKLVFNYDNQGSFGELALMYNTPRAATVIATSDGVLWGLDRLTFKKIICGSASRKRQMYQSLLESVPMLKSLEPYELMNLADALQRKYYEDGEAIIQQGDSADAFYIVEEGAVKITRADPNAPGNNVELSTCTPGQYFGELALITNKPRAATALAVGSVTCAVLDVGAFERLLGPCMDIMKRTFTSYEERLQQLFGTTLNISDTR